MSLMKKKEKNYKKNKGNTEKQLFKNNKNRKI